METLSLRRWVSLALLASASLFGVFACGPAEPFENEPGLADAGELPADDAGAVEEPDAGPRHDPFAELADCEPLDAPLEPDDYSGIAHLRDDALRNELHDLVASIHEPVSYNKAKSHMFGSSGFDVRGGKVECIYTGRRFSRGTLDKSGGFNVEHSWPQSEFGGAVGAKSDMHHLFPTDPDANSRRSSLPYGNTDCVSSPCRWSEAGSEVGRRIGGYETVFEVRPEFRGEVARAHFYFAVRYGMSIPEFEETALRRWNRCDPPDDRERARNDAIERRQGNRNPFVDRPDLVDAISDF
jgi:deoxyribonuclease-1